MLSLEEAIQKIKILWEKDRNKTIPIEVAYSHLGYKTIGGYASRVIAAMKKYGLIYEKQNDIILTEEAIDLALHEPSDDIYIETIKKLALKPTIYGILFNEYNGNLPSDATLKIKLIKEPYEFNPDKVSGFISDFRKTIEFAKLDRSETTGDENTMENETMTRTKFPSPSPSPSAFISTLKPTGSVNREREIATYTIGRGLTARIIISGADNTTPKSISKLIKFLLENEEDLPESIEGKTDGENKD
jgi:effector-binding domain-containing protein